MTLMQKFRRGGLLSFGHMKGKYPILEPYVLLGIGVLASAFMTIRGIIDGDTWGDIFHGQSIMYIILAIVGVMMMFAGYMD